MRISLIIASGLSMISTGVLARSAPPPPEPTNHPDWASVRDQGVSEITSALFDPSSVQINWSSGFSWGFAKPIIGRRTFGWIACGNLNAKNRLGGYVGAKPFWIMADASGAVTSGWVADTMSTCDNGLKTAINPELVNTSPVTPVTLAPTSIADELEKLAQLRDKGVITQEEFEKQKAKLLAR
jgi:hypothetical protein